MRGSTALATNWRAEARERAAELGRAYGDAVATGGWNAERLARQIASEDARTAFDAALAGRHDEALRRLAVIVLVFGDDIDRLHVERIVDGEDQGA